MRSMVDGDLTRLLFWRDVREYAVPPSMVATATARRCAGDWAGACAAARVDVDLHVRAVAREYGDEVARELRSDLAYLAPDLLRWHMPRMAPDGVLRPGLTVALAGYGPVWLVVRTPPRWADAGQRMSLALWDAARPGAGAGGHPHPHPDRRYRLDLHRHLWDVRRTADLPRRCGWDPLPDNGFTDPDGILPTGGAGYATHRWAAEAALVLGSPVPGARCPENGSAVAIRIGGRTRLRLDLFDFEAGPPKLSPLRRASGWLPELPDAAVWTPPDVDLLRRGLIEPGRLHPLVAAALVPDHVTDPGDRPERDGERLVDCHDGGSPAVHRIGLVQGTLTALDHDPAQVRREELLAALGGPPLPCLREIDRLHRAPEDLDDIRARLAHGDAAGALAVVEQLLGPGASLRAGGLRDLLDAAAAGKVVHGLYRADVRPEPLYCSELHRPGFAHARTSRPEPKARHRRHPRHATAR